MGSKVNVEFSNIESLINEYRSSPDWTTDYVDFMKVQVRARLHQQMCYDGKCECMKFDFLSDADFRKILSKLDTFLNDDQKSHEKPTVTGQLGTAIMESWSPEQIENAFQATNLNANKEEISPPYELQSNVVHTEAGDASTEAVHLNTLLEHAGSSSTSQGGMLFQPPTVERSDSNIANMGQKGVSVACATVPQNNIPQEQRQGESDTPGGVENFINPVILCRQDYVFPVELLQNTGFWEQVKNLATGNNELQNQNNRISLATSVAKEAYNLIFTDEEKLNCSQRSQKLPNLQQWTRKFDAIKKELVFSLTAFVMENPDKGPVEFLEALHNQDESLKLPAEFRDQLKMNVFTIHASNARKQQVIPSTSQQQV